MRSRILIPAAVILLVATVVTVARPGEAEDLTNQRLNDLETRVAALETQVAASSPEPASAGDSEDDEDGQDGSDGENGRDGRDGKDGQDGQSGSSSSSSSSSSSQQGSSSYAATYSSNGDRVIEFDIERAGDYHLTASTSSAFSAVIETETGEPVPGFEIDVATAETLDRTGRLEPGNYVLRVTATSNWTITITSMNP